MIDWIKNRKLNNSSAFFVGIALFVSMLSSAIYIFFIHIFSIPRNNIAEITLTILIPTFINLLIIPAFKIISFYQNIDEKIIKNEVTDEKIKYYNEKQIVYTEALLTCTTALPTFFWYVDKGINYLTQNNLELPNGIKNFVKIAVLIIGILAIKKLRNISKKQQKRDYTIMIDWIKSRKLNNTSELFIGITYTIAIISPYFYMMVIPDKDILNNVGDNVMTILIPTFINLLIIPAFKIISFYQNIDEKRIKDEVTKEKIKHYNEKQIVYTEALLTCTTALPIFLLYVYQGTYSLSQKQPELTLFVTLIISIILVIIGVRVLIKKFRR